MEILMQKPAKKSAHPKRSQKTAQRRSKPAVAPTSMAAQSESVERTSKDTKQARVIAMLQAPSGATAAAIMQQTGWQPHSVRGFLAGVIRKKLKLTLHSTKVDGKRVYRIEGDTQSAAANVPSPRRRAA
jgi:outer membrane biosynthesis protein TonB